MTPAGRDDSVRAYLLGTADPDQAATLEEEYFDDPDVLDRIGEIEDDLIAGYLDGRLAPGERASFESHYLASPYHRTRVEMMRRLRHGSPAASRPALSPPAARPLPDRRTTWTRATLALAAGLVLAVAGVAWLARGGAEIESLDVRAPSAPETAPPASTPSAPDAAPSVPSPITEPPAARRQPVTLALSLSPVAVRGAGDPATLIVSESAELVRLQLEGEDNERLGRDGRVLVRTVAGREVWRGAAAPADGPGLAFAVAEVPADRLLPEDYIVELRDHGPAGDTERHRYFLRVRR